MRIIPQYATSAARAGPTVAIRICRKQVGSGVITASDSRCGATAQFVQVRHVKMLSRRRGIVHPNCTERRVSVPAQNPVIGNSTGRISSAAAPAATTTGAKCSCVGSATLTAGAFWR